MGTLKPCPGCGWPKARMFGKTQYKSNDAGLTAIEDAIDNWGGYIEVEVEMIDFRYGFYYRCNKCGWKSPIVWTPWHIRTQEEAEDWCRDQKYWGFEQDSEWAKPYRDETLRLWNTRYERTCHCTDEKEVGPYHVGEYTLSCGHKAIVLNRVPNYCPECGAKVVRADEDDGR